MKWISVTIGAVSLIIFFFNIFLYFYEIMTHIQYMMLMMDVQADYGYIKKSHRKQQIHLHTRDLEPMLIRGRSPAIVGGSTSNQNRPNCHVPAGSEINRRRIEPPSCWASVVDGGPTLTQERLDASRWPGSQC